MDKVYNSNQTISQLYQKREYLNGSIHQNWMQFMSAKDEGLLATIRNRRTSNHDNKSSGASNKSAAI